MAKSKSFPKIFPESSGIPAVKERYSNKLSLLEVGLEGRGKAEISSWNSSRITLV